MRFWVSAIAFSLVAGRIGEIKTHRRQLALCIHKAMAPRPGSCRWRRCLRASPKVLLGALRDAWERVPRPVVLVHVDVLVPPEGPVVAKRVDAVPLGDLPVRVVLVLGNEIAPPDGNLN